MFQPARRSFTAASWQRWSFREFGAGRLRRERGSGPSPHQPCSPAPRGQRPHPAQVSESVRRARHRLTLVDRATWLDAWRRTNSANHESIGRARYERLDFVSSGRPSNTRETKLPFRHSPSRSGTRMIKGARQLSRQHVTIRVPWHDSGWTGRVRKAPFGEHILSCVVAHRRHQASR